MKICSLFSGIGGLEFGFHAEGFQTIYFNELDPFAQRVLKTRYEGVPVETDVSKARSIPDCDVLTAGFPCQDLSLAGPKSGLVGARSGLVNEIFRLLEAKPKTARPPYLVFENVAYMVRLAGGSALTHITDELERLGYSWAYRVLDARAFGTPQRRHRIIIIATLDQSAAGILFPADYGQLAVTDGIDDKEIDIAKWYGFYWTEGRRGLGWAENSVPPIKGGSSIGIPSPPAIWQPEAAHFGTISLSDAERLQGFPSGWTDVFEGDKQGEKSRWKLIGNAVCTPMSNWIARRIKAHGEDIACNFYDMQRKRSWPMAGFGREGKRFQVDASMYPEKCEFIPLKAFLNDPLKPLSHRAISGYYSRVVDCSCRPPARFVSDIRKYIESLN